MEKIEKCELRGYQTVYQFLDDCIEEKITKEEHEERVRKALSEIGNELSRRFNKEGGANG